MADLIEPGVFDEDYLHFYETILTPERNDAEADLIVRLGGLQPGEEVLDAPCGHGRLSNRLAARGMRVTGIDASPLFLDRARTEAAGLGVEVSYVEGDMRSMPFAGRFDALVNWFTSFGYHDDETNRATLAGFHRALKPGGRIVIEHMNRERVVRFLGGLQAPGAVGLLTEREDDLQIDVNSFDPLTGRISSERTIIRHGGVRRVRFAVRVFAFTELRDWLRDAGFTSVEGYDADGAPLSLDSGRMVVVARA
jgi:SAM-dependent methyltransferase